MGIKNVELYKQKKYADSKNIYTYFVYKDGNPLSVNSSQVVFNTIFKGHNLNDMC